MPVIAKNKIISKKKNKLVIEKDGIEELLKKVLMNLKRQYILLL